LSSLQPHALRVIPQSPRRHHGRRGNGWGKCDVVKLVAGFVAVAGSIVIGKAIRLADRRASRRVWRMKLTKLKTTQQDFRLNAGDEERR
jgi:hypothetical protein